MKIENWKWKIENGSIDAFSPQQAFRKLAPEKQETLAVLADIFLEENAKLNLSAHRTKARVWEGNVMDSLVGLGLEQFSIFHSQFSILDLGTGGGFPLLPLAITLPQHHYTGLDSTRKKMDAMQRMIDQLKLPNVGVITARAEELGKHDAYREKYDIVTARAVAKTSLLLEYCAPFVKVGGQILLWKSMNCDEEISAASGAESKLFLKRKDPIVYDLGDTWGKRQILIYEKTKATPLEYPRPVGAAKKYPL